MVLKLNWDVAQLYSAILAQRNQYPIPQKAGNGSTIL